MSIATALTIIAGAGFTHAMIVGAVSLHRGTRFFAAVMYVTIIAGANALFRGYTLYHRLNGYDLPQPFSTNTALVLQVSLAAALVIIAGVTKLQVEARRAIGEKVG